MTVPALEKPRLGLVEKVVSLPLVELLDTSPDGRFAIVLTNRTGSFQLATLPVDGGPLRDLTHGKERVAWARVSNNSRDIAFSRDFGGKEEHQLFRVSITGSMEEQLAKLPPIRIFDFAWSGKDDRIAFAGATQEFNGIWLLDPSNGSFRDVYRGRHEAYSPDWDPEDSEICFSAKTTDLPTAFELLFLGGDGKGEPRVYTPKPGSENTLPKWHPLERRVLFKTDARGRYELAVYNVDDGRLSYLKGGELGLGFDFPVFDWNPDGSEVFYLASREGRTRLFFEKLDGAEPPRQIQIPDGYHGGFLSSTVKVPSDGHYIVFSWSSLSKPCKVSRYDTEWRKVETLYEERTEIPLGKAEHVVYRSFDGLPIQGWFLKQPGYEGPRPCVLWIHGGPAWEVADEWNGPVQSLTVGGLNVFAPNIRGSTGYGVEFQNMNIHDVGGADLKDVEKAAEYLKTRPDVDPEKIAIVGASYGGYMTFLATTKLPSLWAAGAAVVGITDWEEMYELSDASFKSFIEKYFGTPGENRELYRDRSPIHFVENLKAPLLIWHRGNDSRCPLKPVEKFANQLRELGKRFEMEVVWDEGHGFQKTENLARQYKAIATFLNRELGMA